MQQFTEPQNMVTYILPNNILPLVEQTSQRQNSGSGNPIKRPAQAIAGIAIQQRAQTLSAVFKPTTNTLIFDGKNEKV